MSDIIHHPGHTIEEVESWYDYWFDHASPGDWRWSSRNIDGTLHKTIMMVVPLVPPDYRHYGKLAERGGELLSVFVERARNDWNEPGPVIAWDGDDDNPTLTPSIFCRGAAKVKGWHGFFKKGELVNLDGSIVGR